METHFRPLFLDSPLRNYRLQRWGKDNEQFGVQKAFDPFLPSLKGQEYVVWQKRWTWMICEPDEKEGKFLLDEIMQAGNFGKYDDRIKHDGSQFSHAIEKTKHNMRLVRHYPEEVMWEPFFRVYHWVWRRFELWRY